MIDKARLSQITWQNVMPTEVQSIITELLELRSLRSTEGKEGEPVAWQRRLMNPVDDVNGHKAGVWGGWQECSAEQARYAKETGSVDGFRPLRAQVRPLYATPEAAEAHVAKLREALEPFAEAAENLDDNHADGSPIWETSAAMGIDAIHLRAARAALTRSPE